MISKLDQQLFNMLEVHMGEEHKLEECMDEIKEEITGQMILETPTNKLPELKFGDDNNEILLALAKWMVSDDEYDAYKALEKIRENIVKSYEAKRRDKKEEAYEDYCQNYGQ